ncbi:MAG: hypothetical protein ACTSO3_11310 [Candidatus Heimdallarchaeaceae archaeon]
MKKNKLILIMICGFVVAGLFLPTINNAQAIVTDYCNFKEVAGYTFPAEGTTLYVENDYFVSLEFYLSSGTWGGVYYGYGIDMPSPSSNNVGAEAYNNTGVITSYPYLKSESYLSAIELTSLSSGYHTISVFCHAYNYDALYRISWDNASSTRYFYLSSTTGSESINATVIGSYDEYYLNSAPVINFGTEDADGLNNCTLAIDDYVGFPADNQTDNYNDLVSNLSVNQTITIPEDYAASGYEATFSNVEKWDSGSSESIFYDDDGASYNSTWYINTLGTWAWTGQNTHLETRDTIKMEFTSDTDLATAGVEMSLSDLNNAECTSMRNYTIEIRTNTATQHAFTLLVQIASDRYLGIEYNPSNDFDFVILNGKYVTATQIQKTDLTSCGTGSFWSNWSICVDENFLACWYNGDLKANETTSAWLDEVDYSGEEGIFSFYFDRGITTQFYRFRNFYTNGESAAGYVSSSVVETGLTSTAVTFPQALGVDYDVQFTSTIQCRFDVEIKTTRTGAVYVLYSTSTTTSQYDLYVMNSTIWDSISEGVFWINVTLFDDSDHSITTNFQYCKLTSVTLKLLSPLNNSLYNLGEPIGFTYSVTTKYGASSTETTYLNGTEKDYEVGDSLLLAAGFWNISIKTVDEAGNTAFITHSFEVINYKTMRVTYLTQFFNKIDFDRFTTNVTTNRFPRYTELDSYILIEDDDSAIIETYNEQNYLVANNTIEFEEHVFITLPVHFIQFSCRNNTFDAQVTLTWELGDTSGKFTFIVNSGAISEEYMIYRDATYQISISAHGYETFTEEVSGTELKHGVVSINLTPNDNVLNTIDFSDIWGWVWIVGSGFSLGLTFWTRIVNIEDTDKRRLALTIFLLALVIVCFISFWITNTAWQTIALCVATIGMFVIAIRKGYFSIGGNQ